MSGSAYRSAYPTNRRSIMCPLSASDMTCSLNVALSVSPCPFFLSLDQIIIIASILFHCAVFFHPPFPILLIAAFSHYIAIFSPPRFSVVFVFQAALGLIASHIDCHSCRLGCAGHGPFSPTSISAMTAHTLRPSALNFQFNRSLQFLNHGR